MRKITVVACRIPKCPKPSFSSGMCQGHYRRYQRGTRGPDLLKPVGRPYLKIDRVELARDIQAAIDAKSNA